jgi:predicted lipid-binding transport protein (Tim44 family)
MDGRIDVTTLLFLVLAVVIFLKLRSVLGRRTGHEEARFERYKAQKEASQRNGKLAGQDKVVTLPRREREDVEPRPAADQQAQADSEQRVKEYAAGNTDITKGLLDIVRIDTSFDPSHFLQGAKAAYEIIVTAFAEGNRRTLKDLLSPEV